MTMRADDIAGMQMARTVRLQHADEVYEGVVRWIQANDDPLSHERSHPNCVSLMLRDGSTLNDLPQGTSVEKL